MQSGRIGQELIEGEDAVEAVRDFVYGSVPSSVEALNRKKGDSSSWERIHANQADARSLIQNSSYPVRIEQERCDTGAVRLE